jgi:hypothetical protein
MFYAAQAASVFAWSSASDRVGRKPILLAGLVGICFSLTCAGLSKTFWGLLVRQVIDVSGLILILPPLISSVVVVQLDSLTVTSVSQRALLVISPILLIDLRLSRPLRLCGQSEAQSGV